MHGEATFDDWFFHTSVATNQINPISHIFWGYTWKVGGCIKNHFNTPHNY